MASQIPQAFIDEVLAQTDLASLIEIHLPLKKQGTNFVACCPFHHEKTPSFNVIPRKQFYYCFGCGASGNAISFLMAYLHLGFLDALEGLAARLGKTLPKADQAVTAPLKRQRSALHALLDTVNHYYQQCLQTNGQAAQAYLTQRGVSPDISARYQLGYAPAVWHALETHFPKETQALLTSGMLVQQPGGKQYDRYRNRIMFPIHDRSGHVVGFGARALDEVAKPKYLNSPETPIFHKGHELYGLFQLLKSHQTHDAILVVEGYMDVIMLAQYGIDCAVATLGTATTAHHLRLLQHYASQIIFCFDGDEAGRKAAWRALENALPLIGGQLTVSFMFLPPTHDPDSFIRAEGKEAFLTLMKQSLPLNTFFFAHLTQGLALDTLAGRSQLVEQALGYFNQMPDGPYRLLLLSELSRLSRIDKERIQQWVDNKSLPEQHKRAWLTVERSPLRIAIALLLQHPEHLIDTLKTSDVEISGEEPGGEILKALIQYLKHTPSVTTAVLVEQWRQTPWFDAVQKLSCWDHRVPEDTIQQEFDEIIVFLKRQFLEKQIQNLLSQSRLQGLQPDEQNRLQGLLKKRHKLPQ